MGKNDNLVNEEIDKKIYDVLCEIQKLVSNLLNLNIEKVEIMALKILSSMYSKEEGMESVVEIINKHIDSYKEEYERRLAIRHYIVLEQYIIPEIKKELPLEKIGSMPDMFEQYYIVHFIVNLIINDEFKKIYELELNRQDRFLITDLKKSINHILIENANMEGPIPYYRRNLDKFLDSRELNAELLNEKIEAVKALFCD